MITIIGDDLTGTAEAAAVFHRYGYRAQIGLDTDAAPDPKAAFRAVAADTRQLTPDEAAAVLHGRGYDARIGLDAGAAVWAVDTDTRQLTPEGAAGRAEDAVRRVAPGALLISKLDSLLRGHPVVHLAALRPDRFPVIFTPALPVQGRTVVDGIAWSGDQRIGGASLVELIAPLPAESVPALPVPELTARIARAADRGRIAVCDAADDADLDRLVAATIDLPGVRYAGAADLIAALARRHSADLSELGCPMTQLSSDNSAALVVVGTGSSAAVKQVERLTAARSEVRAWTGSGADWPDRTATEIGTHLGSGGSAVLRLPRSTDREADLVDDPGPVADLAEVVERVINETVIKRSAVPLVLTGGHTARTVLDRLGVTTLTVIGEIHHGAVALRTGKGRTVVTRPGSFGGTDSLVRILDQLHAVTPEERPQ